MRLDINVYVKTISVEKEIMMKDLEMALNYVSTLTLAEPASARILQLSALSAASAAPPPPVKEGEPAANVSANSVVSFTSDLPQQTKEDVLNSTLLAQLAANAAFDPEKQPKEWYQKYNDVLSNIGWNFPSWDFSKLATSDKGFQISKEVIKLIRSVDVTASGMMSVVLASLEADDNKDAAEMFDSYSNPKEQANFQIGPCDYNGGNAVMTSACMYFKATEHKHRFLWVTWKDKSTELWGSARKAELVSSVYENVRQAVKDKLGDRAKNYVMDIQLGDFDTKIKKITNDSAEAIV